MAAKEGARVIATDVNAEVLKQLDGTPGESRKSYITRWCCPLTKSLYLSYIYLYKKVCRLTKLIYLFCSCRTNSNHALSLVHGYGCDFKVLEYGVKLR